MVVHFPCISQMNTISTLANAADCAFVGNDIVFNPKHFSPPQAH